MNKPEQEFDSEETNLDIETFFWECSKCSTINTEVDCVTCGYIPEYYIALNPEEFEEIEPDPEIVPDLETEYLFWTCSKCKTKNDISAVKCSKCRQLKPSPSRFKLFFVASIFVIITLLIIYLLVSSPSSSSIYSHSPIRSTSTNPAKASNLPVDNHVYPAPPIDGCILWSDITSAYTDQTKCVYGLVYDTFLGDKRRFYIRFSDEINTFRVVLMDNVQMGLKAGDCVYQTGEIKAYDKLLYMQTSDQLSICQK